MSEATRGLYFLWVLVPMPVLPLIDGGGNEWYLFLVHCYPRLTFSSAIAVLRLPVTSCADNHCCDFATYHVFVRSRLFVQSLNFVDVCVVVPNEFLIFGRNGPNKIHSISLRSRQESVRSTTSADTMNTLKAWFSPICFFAHIVTGVHSGWVEKNNNKQLYPN